MIRTHEGGIAFEHSLDHFVEFFSKAGSLFVRDPEITSFYEDAESALSLFQKAWIANDKLLAMKLLFWLRDCRGGAGNRSGFRSCVNWLAKHEPNWVKYNLDLIPQYGRWDDLRVLFDTPVKIQAANLWAKAIRQGDILAAKWADRKDIPILKVLKSFGEVSDVPSFRRYLASRRKKHIVEHKMCSNKWDTIVYKKVPSLAMSRYTHAFNKHDTERFEDYKESLKKGETTIHASVLFPHNCVMTAFAGDRKIADAQFEALPNYLEKSKERIIVVCDTSGSMCTQFNRKSKVQAIHVSVGMSLYCSSKIGSGPFYKKFIAFESESEFKDWESMTFSEACNNSSIFDAACGATRIDKALDLILKTAKFFKLSNDQMPTMLLIISDMQFHLSVSNCRTDTSEVAKAMYQWKKDGYHVPKIVYWNIDGYAGQPSTVDIPNTALISGFSPAILQAFFEGNDLTPRGVMLKALEKYQVKVP